VSEAIVYRVKRGEEKRREEWVWLGREMVFMRKRLWFWVGGHTPAKRKRGLTNGKERKGRREVEEKQLQLQLQRG